MLGDIKLVKPYTFNVAVLLIAHLCGLVCNGQPIPQMRTFSQRAVYRKMPNGAPRYQDIIFSSRFPHPSSKSDGLNTFKSAEAFFASRLEWVYAWDKSWIATAKRRGYTFGGTLNAMLPDEIDGHVRHRGRILDSIGRLVEAPWMRGWGTYWGCVNSPEYKAIFLKHAKALVDAGVDFIQVDDAKINSAARRWGGCHCRHCKDKAAKDHKTIHEIQDESVVEFFVAMRKEIDKYAGRHVAISSNNPNGDWSAPYNLFDFGVAELSDESALPGMLYAKFKAAEVLGKAQTFTYVSANVQKTRKVIALSYASGGHVIVPWDVYLKSTPTGAIRYYAKPEDFSDIFGLIKANASVFNQHEEAAVYGAELIKATNDQKPLLITNGGRQVYAFVRAVPNDADAQIAIHLVDWADKPEKFTLVLDSRYLQKNRRFKFQLATTSLYPRVSSAGSKDSKHFSNRVTILPRQNGNMLHFDIPAVNPYTLLIITPF